MRCAYVYAHDGKRFQCVGELDYSEEPESFTFRYSQEWLNRPDAFSIDPFNLPLTENDFQDSWLPGSIGDIQIDPFAHKAVRLALRGSGVRRRSLSGNLNPAAHILGSPSSRTGFLAFGADKFGPAAMDMDLAPFSPQEAPGDAHQFGFRVLERRAGPLLQVPVADVDENRLHLFIEAFGSQWVAKVSGSNGTAFDAAHKEAACLDMAEAMGIETPDRMVLPVQGGGYALLVQRFDRYVAADGSIVPLGTVSAHRVLWRPGVEVGYADLQRALDRAGGADCRADLFRRMLLNIAINNTDDHLGNHTFLRRPDGEWTLSPVYDLVPQKERTRRSMSSRHVADDLNDPSTMLYASGHELGLDDATIAAEIVAAAAVTDRWEEFMRDRGARPHDVAQMARVMRPLNQNGVNQLRMAG